MKRLDGIIKVAAIYIMAQLFWIVVCRYCMFFWKTAAFGQVIIDNAGAFRKPREEQPGGRMWKPEDWISPYWHLWYLQYLVFWRMALPFWWRLKWPLISAWLTSAAWVAFEVNPAYLDPKLDKTWAVIHLN